MSESGFARFRDFQHALKMERQFESPYVKNLAYPSLTVHWEYHISLLMPRDESLNFRRF